MKPRDTIKGFLVKNDIVTSVFIFWGLRIPLIVMRKPIGAFLIQDEGTSGGSSNYTMPGMHVVKKEMGKTWLPGVAIYPH